MRAIYLIVFCTLIVSCSDPESNDINELDWIIGKWTSTSGAESMTEHWQKEAGALIGEAWFISSNDTISSEQLKIITRGNDIFYIASPSDQMTTEFKLKQLNDNEVLFENPEHDFPQSIYYKRLSSDSLYAKIEGKINDQPQAMEFFWKLTGQ